VINYLLMRLLPRFTATNCMSWFSLTCLVIAGVYHLHFKPEGAYLDIDLVFMINFVKIHMMAVNYDNGFLLDKENMMTSREKFYAEPLRERVKFADFCDYFFFCAASWTGMPHEYREFNEFINKKG